MIIDPSVIRQVSREKDIDAEKMFGALEEAMSSAARKYYHDKAMVTLIDRQSGEMTVYSPRTVVSELDTESEEPPPQVLLEEAQALIAQKGTKGEVRVLRPGPEGQPATEVHDLALGDEVRIYRETVGLGRIAAQTAKQVILQRIREAEREMKYEEYAGREGDIVTGIIQQTDARYTLLDLGKVEALLPQAEQVQNERYEHGSRLKAYIVEVRKTAKGPQIVVSRTHPGLVKRLFELEVPEIVDGVVEIKAIAREPGHRTKLAVASNDNNVDPVGACVGARGSRVRMVVNELRGEKVDIVPYSENNEEFVMKALAPARVREVRIHTETGTAEVIVPDFQLSLAIGKEGQNARLAARLTGWRVDIKSETQLQEEEAGGGVEYAEGEWVKNASGELVWQPAEGGEAISAAEAGYAAPDPTVVAAKEGDGNGAAGDKAAAAKDAGAESSNDTPADSSSESAEESPPAPEPEASETETAAAAVPGDGGDAATANRGEDGGS